MRSTNLLSTIFFASICLSVKNINCAKILGIFPLQSKSHWIMFKEVLEGLADAGHEVDVVTHFPREKPYKNYKDLINLHGTIPAFNNNMTHDMIQTFGIASIKVVVDLTGNDICKLLELPQLKNLIKNPPTDPPYDLVIAESFLASCYFAFGRHLKVPVIGISSRQLMSYVNSAVGNPFNPAIVSEGLPERPASNMNFRQRFVNTIVDFYTNLQTRYHMRLQNDIVKKSFGAEMPDVEQLERELSLVLVNSHPIFHGVRPFTPAVVEVAGIHIRDDNTPIPKDLKKWLDDSKHGFIYFSLGSMVKIESFPKSDLAEIYSGLVRVAPIRILMKVANPEELPPGLPENVKTLTWAPQVQVLKHENIRGFLTHGGLMGLQEAVAFAVPLIGMPLFGDQAGNIDICVHREFAVVLDYENLRADDIAGAINAVANDPKYKKNVEALSKQFLDRPRDPRSTAVFWIEYILKHGEGALRSPALNLTWWQLELLDVYGTILAAILLVLYVIKLILFAIIRQIFHRNKIPLSKKRN